MFAVVLVAAIVCISPSFGQKMSLDVEGARHFRTGNLVYIYPELGSDLVIKYTYNYLMVAGVKVWKHPALGDAVLKYNLGFNEEPVLKELEVNEQFKVLQDESFSFSIQGFQRRNNGSYVLKSETGDGHTLIAYFDIVYREFISFRPVSITHEGDDPPKVLASDVKHIDVDVNRVTTVGMKYSVYGIGRLTRFIPMINNFDFSDLFVRYDTMKLNDTSMESKYFVRGEIYLLLDLNKVSRCILTGNAYNANANAITAATTLSMSLTEYDVTFSRNLKRSYSIRPTGTPKPGENECGHSTKLKYNGLYQSYVLRCVHYLREEYVRRANEAMNLVIKFSVKENGTWERIAVYSRNGLETVEAALDGSHFVQGSHWTDLAFEDVKSTQVAAKCEVTLNGIRIASKPLKFQYVEGSEASLNKKQKQKLRNRNMSKIESKLSIGAFKRALGTGPLLIIVAAFTILACIMAYQRRAYAEQPEKVGNTKSSIYFNDHLSESYNQK